MSYIIVCGSGSSSHNNKDVWRHLAVVAETTHWKHVGYYYYGHLLLSF